MMQFIIPILIILGAVLFSLYRKSKKQNPLDKTASWPYGKAAQLLNPLEISFYQALSTHLHPGLLILVKVRIQNLVYVPPNGRLAERLEAKMRDKYLDFVICDAADFRPVCAVAFDDAVDPDKNAEDAPDMEKILDAAGLALFRYVPQYEYKQADFDTINALFTTGNF